MAGLIREVIFSIGVVLLFNSHDAGALSVCPTYWTSFNNNCYRYFGTPLSTWTEAKNYCHAVQVPVPGTCIDGKTTTGISHLVSILSVEEQEFVRAFWRMSREDGVYHSTYPNGYRSDRLMAIGLNDIANEGVYEWTDGSPVSYLNWAQGEPNNGGSNEDGVHMWESDIRFHLQGSWNDIIINANYFKMTFMCKIPAY